MFERIVRLCSALLVTTFITGGASAAELTIGSRATPTIDPHFLFLTSNVAYNSHIYGLLVARDENARRVPDLATSWEAIDDTTWEFKLREGVKFHDGSEFTAEDVVFSIERIPNVPNNPNPYTGTIRTIAGMEIVDSHTIRFKTDGVNPYLPDDFTEVIIVSKKAAEGATTEDFNSGKAAIGTGPYKFSEHVHGERLVLERHDDYWGGTPTWDRVTFQIISDDAARVAALLGGDVDMIDFVPPTDIGHLEKNADINVFKRPSDRIIYFFPNVRHDTSPYLTDRDGNPLDRNPLRDRRVRKAISMGINRDAIAAKVMEGLAAPAGQTVPEGWFGYNPELGVEPYDPDGAKKLLAEAGYPDGFGLTIHGPNDRYVNDSKICQAVGQMLARIGLDIKVDTMPKSVFFSKVKVPNVEFSFGLLGWGNSPYPASGHIGLLHSYDKDKGAGAYNRAGYANPAYDAAIQEAVSTVDDAERERREQAALKIAMDDVALVPMHVQFTIAAARKGLDFVPRADESTFAMNATPVQ